MNKVATQDQRVVDPDYVGFFRILGEEHLQKRQYVRAWNEFRALGDFGQLRRVIETYAGDVEAFEAAMFHGMLEEYALGYVRQYNAQNPLKHFRPRLHKVVEAHVLAGSVRRARIAWTIQRSYFQLLPEVGDRKAYFPALEELHKQLAASGEAGVRGFAAEIQIELNKIRTDYYWRAE